jgi:hypothetical protein
MSERAVPTIVARTPWHVGAAASAAAGSKLRKGVSKSAAGKVLMQGLMTKVASWFAATG